MRVSQTGTFVFSWEQVEVDGITGATPSQMVPGAAWRWTGAAVRLQDMQSVLLLCSETDPLRAKAARHVHRMLHDPARPEALDAIDSDAPANSFDLTDGLEVFQAVIVDNGLDRPPLIMFENRLPPQGQDLWVLRQEVRARETAEDGNGMLCFVPGTLIETERGAVPVEELTEHDRLSTRDSGYQCVLWTGQKRVSGARMLAMPALRPVHISADLFGLGQPRPDLYVSPDHRVLIQNDETRALFGEAEVLVAARDLIDTPGVRLSNRAQSVDYIHLMLDGHHIVTANGVACESFHPALADLRALDTAQKTHLETLFPGLIHQPMIFGQFARRMLNRAEAAILSYGLRA